MVPRILIVVRVPKDVDQWLEADDEALMLRHCGYWTSVRGAGERPENQAGVTVRLPSERRFDAGALAALMKGIAAGVWP
jgi:hypothetical protein